jgi:hypothetical protein
MGKVWRQLEFYGEGRHERRVLARGAHHQMANAFTAAMRIRTEAPLDGKILLGLIAGIELAAAIGGAVFFVAFIFYLIKKT